MSTTPEDDTTTLPPYSGDPSVCAKCSYIGAVTVYRPAEAGDLAEINGRMEVRGPLPERLERACQRCCFQWDEATSTDTAATKRNPTPDRDRPHRRNHGADPNQ